MAAHRFGGEAAQLLWRTLHWSSIFVGAVALALSVAVVLLLGRLPNASGLIPPLLGCLAFALVARVALDAVHSRDLGSLWRGSGAGPAELSRALGRVVLANLGWLIPFAVILQRSAETVALQDRIAPIAVASILALTLPPLLLIIALGANSWPQLLQSQHWQSTLSGRGADVVQLYSSYLGATLGMGLVLWGAVLGFGSGEARLTLFLSLVAGSYHGGMAILLLGRLVGGFLASGDAAAEPLEDPDALQDVDRHLEPRPILRPAAAAEAVAPPVVSPRPAAQVRAEADPDSLLVRLRQIERSAGEDPGVALTELVQLLHERGPHPLVLARMAILELQLGMPSAESVAKDAVQLARQTANTGALAELQVAFAESAERIGIGPQDWLRIAAVHTAMGREAEAIELYTQFLSSGIDPAPALKALLKIAEGKERQDRDLETAMSIYATILRLAPGHAFAEFAERGRSTIERKLQRTN